MIKEIKIDYILELTPWIYNPETGTVSWSWKAWLNIKWRILLGKKVKANIQRELE